MASWGFVSSFVTLASPPVLKHVAALSMDFGSNLFFGITIKSELVVVSCKEGSTHTVEVLLNILLGYTVVRYWFGEDDDVCSRAISACDKKSVVFELLIGKQKWVCRLIASADQIEGEDDSDKGEEVEMADLLVKSAAVVVGLANQRLKNAEDVRDFHYQAPIE
ncbi:hypothetical protein U1Q18_032640 [Sarracenia purpurea var. burkii]